MSVEIDWTPERVAHLAAMVACMMATLEAVQANDDVAVQQINDMASKSADALGLSLERFMVVLQEACAEFAKLLNTGKGLTL